MTSKTALLALAALALAACTQGNDVTSPYPSGGGSAGAEGEGYCDSPPADIDDLETWQQQCAPGER